VPTFLGGCWKFDASACSIVKRGETLHSFDYIVVGSGPAGSTIANRLVNANSGRKVLLIEQGKDPNANSVVKFIIFFKLKLIFFV
jgi:predicted oxidoreductase